MRGASGEINKARIFRQIGTPQCADQPCVLLLAHQRDDDPAVAGSVDAGRYVQLPRCAALEDMFGELVAKDRRRTLRQTDLEIPAFAAALARIERDGESLRRIEPGQSVDDDRPDPVRRPVIPEIDRDQAGKGLRDRVGAGQSDMGALLAKAADREIEEPRIARTQLFIAEPEPGSDTRTEALDHDVG